MDFVIIALSVILGIAVLSALLWLYMIFPGGKRQRMQRFVGVHYAHRGLHDESKAENSMSAFRAAKEHGYGIELDVRLSKDGELVVFHDDTLIRVTGNEGKVKDFTSEELAKMKLSGTDEGRPTFREVLELIDGSVPLLIELKELTSESGLAEKFVEVISDYKGEYIVESFNPMTLRRLRRLRPDMLRGILSTTYTKEDKYKGKILYYLGEKLLLNFFMRPNFISYIHTGYTTRNLGFIRRVFGTPLLTWTVKSQAEENAAYEHGFDTVIFEGYIPENKGRSI